MIISWDGLDNIIILNCDNREEFLACLSNLKKISPNWEITRFVQHTKEEVDDWQKK